ncbi:MAG: hypothetical protein JWN67_1046 [Actinomycetia bacterium]|nr:hypothetical protein [Actinomycetes bacterium]
MTTIDLDPFQDGPIPVDLHPRASGPVDLRVRLTPA